MAAVEQSTVVTGFSCCSAEDFTFPTLHLSELQMDNFFRNGRTEQNGSIQPRQVEPGRRAGACEVGLNGRVPANGKTFESSKVSTDASDKVLGILPECKVVRCRKGGSEATQAACIHWLQTQAIHHVFDTYGYMPTQQTTRIWKTPLRRSLEMTPSVPGAPEPETDCSSTLSRTSSGGVSSEKCEGRVHNGLGRSEAPGWEGRVHNGVPRTKPVTKLSEATMARAQSIPKMFWSSKLAHQKPILRVSSSAEANLGTLTHFSTCYDLQEE